MSSPVSVFQGLAQDKTTRALRTDRVASHRDRSAARSRAAFDDGLVFIERWSDLAGWSSATAVVVSNGRVSGNSQGSGSGINHAFQVASGERARVRYAVTSPVDLGSGRMIVGFSSDAPGVAATAGGAAAIGISFTSTTIRQWNSPTGGGETTIGTPGGVWTWYVTFTIDHRLITATAVRSDGNVEFRASWPRTYFPTINNLYVFHSAGAGTANAFIGFVGARRSIATVAPRSGVEDPARSVHWTTAPDGVNNVRIALPPNFDSRVPSPLVLAAHSHGNSETLYGDDTQAKSVANTLADAGYIVVSTAAAPIGTEFGNQALLDATFAAYRYTRDHYNIGPVFSYGISMGGLASLLTAVDQRIPGIAAWAGSSPICSLSYAYAQTAWTAEMKVAYGLASDGSDYTALTAGHDPITLPVDRFAGLPMLFVASPADTVVTKAANTDALAARLAAVTSTTVLAATGEHNDASQYPAAQIVAFFDRFV